jgi:phage I-like protein
LFSRLVTFDAQQADVAGDQKLWINIARTGEWKGHPRGPFEFTTAVFDQIIANASRRTTPINCDYEHQTFKSGLRGAVPSSGHVLKLERRGDELWALVELTPAAARHVRDGEYRSCSPVIEFEATDRASGDDIGPEMLSLALTNDPFQDGLVPYRLTRSEAMAEPIDEKKKAEDEKALSATAAPAAKEKTAADHAADAALSASEAAKSAAALSGGTPADQQVALAEPAAEADVAAAAEDAADDAGDDVDANSVFDALAEAAGMSKSEVLAKMADNIDEFVAVIQGGKAKTMSANDNSGDIRALRIELGQSSKTVKALTSRLEAAESKLKATEDKAKADKEASIKAHVLSLQGQGKVGPEDQDIEDAVFMFSQNWERAARTYSKQIVPLGKPETEDERNPKATVTAVTLDNLSDKELRTVNFMIDSGIAKDKALQTVGEHRSAGKGN